MCSDLNFFSNKDEYKIPYESINKMNNKSNTKSYIIEKFLHEVNDNWYHNMNFYIHNCRHFSSYVRKLLYNKKKE